MRKALLIAGGIVLLALAFFAGRFTGRGQFFVNGPPRFNGNQQAPFVIEGEPQFSESSAGEVSGLNEDSLTVQRDGEEMTFAIDANTRFITFGASVVIQVGDAVDVRYQLETAESLAVSVTLTDYLSQ
ncbi:MAG: hypothetical protein ACRDFQ_07290 [Anaerolineales bacterium]